ncbi:MAG TPA: tetratricopeptide repeat protein, partial [bacterium]|nr:tetratricopeptide repeat protein [bacterium]
GFNLMTIVFFIPCFTLRAQTVLPAAGLSQPLYNTEDSARSAAMGSALVASAGDPAALMWNPAGLAGLNRMDLALHHNSYFAGTFQETLVFGFPLSGKDGMALSADYVNWGSFDDRDANGVLLGSFTDNDTGLSLGWGREWWKGFSAGLSVRALQQKVKDSSYGSLVATVGVLWSPMPGLECGAAYDGLGTQVQGASNASDLTAGICWNPKTGKDLDWVGALEGDWEAQGVSRLQTGLEGTWRKIFSLRAGYQLDLSDNQLSGFSGLTTGAGICLDDIHFDYAFLPSGDLGTSNRISLDYEFGPSVPQASPSPTPTPILLPVSTPTPVPSLLPTPVSAAPGSSLDIHFRLPDEPDTDAQDNPVGSASEISQDIQAVQQNPQDARAWWVLGRAYYAKGQKNSAIQCFQQTLRLKPDNPQLKQWLENYEK